MVGWYHQFNGHELEKTLRVGDGQGSLACYSPWGRKELDTTERLSSTENFFDLETAAKYPTQCLPHKAFNK